MGKYRHTAQKTTNKAKRDNITGAGVVEDYCRRCQDLYRRSPERLRQ